MDEQVAELVARAQREIEVKPNRFLDQLEAGEVPRERLAVLAGELYHLVSTDRQSFTLLAARFPEPPFLAMANAEEEALRLLRDFAAAVGMGDKELRSYEPQPLCQAYPSYLARTAVFGQRSAVPMALLVNVDQSGGNYARLADALQKRYGFSDEAVAHFRFFAETPQEVLDQAAAVISAALAAGDDPAESVRVARLVYAYEEVFWETMAQ